MQPQPQGQQEPQLRYNTNLKAEVQTRCGPAPHVKMHATEWQKVMAGDPVEINPSIGTGFKVMTAEEWAARWKTNEDFPECLACGSKDTKEHFFVQTWCRGRKWWEAESLCLGCHSFSCRSYRDPDFKTPEEWEKELWTQMTQDYLRPATPTPTPTPTNPASAQAPSAVAAN